MQRSATKGHFEAGAFSFVLFLDSLAPFCPDDEWCFFLWVVEVVACAAVTPTSMETARAIAVSVRIDDSPLGVAAPHGAGVRSMDARAARKVKSTHDPRVAHPWGRW